MDADVHDAVAVKVHVQVNVNVNERQRWVVSSRAGMSEVAATISPRAPVRLEEITDANVTPVTEPAGRTISAVDATTIEIAPNHRLVQVG